MFAEYDQPQLEINLENIESSLATSNDGGTSEVDIKLILSE